MLLHSSKPPIWREVLVRIDINFQELHAIVQGTMGWTNSHLHHFTDRTRSFFIGITDPYDTLGTKDGRKLKVKSYLRAEGDELFYEYDFGDGWQHQIKVQKLLSAEADLRYPHLLRGKGACPPEDCGGIWGYYEMVEAINDPKHERHEDLVEWTGLDKWDTHLFDLVAQQGVLDTCFANAKHFYG